MNVSQKVTLVFLHGWCCQPSDFNAQIDFFSKNCTVIAPNYSEIISQGINSVEDIVTYLYDQLFEYRNIAIIGHSMGGFLALRLSQTDLDIKKVIAIDTTLKLNLTPSEKNFLEALDKKDGREILFENIMNNMVDKRFDDYYVMQNKTYQILSYWQKEPKSFNKLLNETFYFDKSDLLTKLKIPFLYIASASPRISKEELLSMYCKTKYYQVNSGHFITLNAVDKVNSLIKAF